MKSLENLEGPQFQEVTEANMNILAELRMKINKDKTPDFKADAEKYVTNPNKKAILSMDGETPTGFIQMEAESKKLHDNAPQIDVQDLAHILRVAVAEEYRGNKIVDSLLAKADEWAISLGKKGIWLDYLEENKPARNAYDRNGYETAAEFIDKAKGKVRRIAVKRFNNLNKEF